MHYNYQDFAELKKEFDINCLVKMEQRAYDDISEIIRYIEAIKEQIFVINNTEYEVFVELWRNKHNYGNKKVSYDVTAYRKPIIDTVKPNNIYLNKHKSFTGQERKKAFEYADQLVNELHAKLITYGIK